MKPNSAASTVASNCPADSGSASRSRAFVRRDAALMVLDEPTAALDPQAEHDLYERFTHETEGRGDGITVLVTHRFSTVHMADHIVVLDEGRIVEQGAHDALMDRRGRYWKLYTTQARGYAPGDRPDGRTVMDAAQPTGVRHVAFDGASPAPTA
ncbi:ABC transporter ATP-binding protein [Streptomyces sp. M19]